MLPRDLEYKNYIHKSANYDANSLWINDNTVCFKFHKAKRKKKSVALCIWVTAFLKL